MDHSDGVDLVLKLVCSGEGITWVKASLLLVTLATTSLTITVQALKSLKKIQSSKVKVEQEIYAQRYGSADIILDQKKRILRLEKELLEKRISYKRAKLKENEYENLLIKTASVARLNISNISILKKQFSNRNSTESNILIPKETVDFHYTIMCNIENSLGELVNEYDELV